MLRLCRSSLPFVVHSTSSSAIAFPSLSPSCSRFALYSLPNRRMASLSDDLKRTAKLLYNPSAVILSKQKEQSEIEKQELEDAKKKGISASLKLRFVRWKRRWGDRFALVRRQASPFMITSSMVLGCYLVFDYFKIRVNLLEAMLDKDVPIASFYLGIICTIFIFGVLHVGNRSLAFKKAAPAYVALLESLQGNKLALAKLGPAITRGKFSYDHVVKGGPRIGRGKDYNGWEKWYRPRTLKIIMSVNGTQNSGIVHARIQKDSKGFFYCRELELRVIENGEEQIINLLPPITPSESAPSFPITGPSSLTSPATPAPVSTTSPVSTPSTPPSPSNPSSKAPSSSP
eukprot:TRINITY_DN7603_c0_g1_i1.p1 TRINITY_DN7603_c0_g1~~TRINITY_DN7603_c0_g1_i1.p1  ORF type:complete len:359 (+),score=53.04 TRINITY_DN7603_c0_g1_i1:47-1078(+)